MVLPQCSLDQLARRSPSRAGLVCLASLRGAFTAARSIRGRRVSATSGQLVEGTPVRARASTPGYSSSADSLALRDLRAREFPPLPAVPAFVARCKEGVDGSSPSEGSKDVIPICLTAVSSGDDDAAAAVEVFRGRLQEERGHARA